MSTSAIDPIAARDGGFTIRLSEIIGQSFTYMGSDGCRHRGTVTSVELEHRYNYDGPIVLFSVGYSDGHWMPLERCARLMLSAKIRRHYDYV